MRCLLFGHRPQCNVPDWPVINCMRCDKITFQKWYPSARRGWVKRPGEKR